MHMEKRSIKTAYLVAELEAEEPVNHCVKVATIERKEAYRCAESNVRIVRDAGRSTCLRIMQAS